MAAWGDSVSWTVIGAFLKEFVPTPYPTCYTLKVEKNRQGLKERRLQSNCFFLFHSLFSFAFFAHKISPRHDTNE